MVITTATTSTPAVTYNVIQRSATATVLGAILRPLIDMLIDDDQLAIVARFTDILTYVNQDKWDMVIAYAIAGESLINPSNALQYHIGLIFDDISHLADTYLDTRCHSCVEVNLRRIAVHVTSALLVHYQG